MNNDEIISKRNQAIADANKIYNQIINDQTNLVNNQSQQIDNYLQNSESAINQSINNNISALNNASETARRQHETEKQTIMKNYQQKANNIDETERIGYLNSARNRIATSEGSLNDVVQEYNNQIAQAKITGQSIIAQQALKMLKEKYNLYKANIENTNNMLIANQNNKEELTNEYGNLDARYSSVKNDYLDRQQDYNLFNKEMAYKNQQLNTQKTLKEKEYQLDLRDAKESYYRSRSSSSGGSSGGYSFNDTSSGTPTDTSTKNQTATKAPNYKAVATPSLIVTGKASKAMKDVFSSLEATVKKHGYVTDNWLNKKLSGLQSHEANNIRACFRAI